MIIKKSSNGRRTITTADQFEKTKVLPSPIEKPKRKPFKKVEPRKIKQYKTPPVKSPKKKKGCGCGK